MVGLEFLWIVPEWALHEVVMVKLHWKPQEARDVRNMGHLLREDLGKKQGSPRERLGYSWQGCGIGAAQYIWDPHPVDLCPGPQR